MDYYNASIMKRLLLQIWKKLLFKSYRISYSQMGEDLVLQFILKDTEWSNFFYVDIGANDPVKYSNTYAMYKNGASGICVEPNPSLAKSIMKKRPRDIVVNAGIGTSDNHDADFYEMTWPAFSTFDADQAEVIEKKYGGLNKVERVTRIRLLPVSNLFREVRNNKIDFLSLDVEGLDLEILCQWDFERYAPKLICVELFDPKTKSKNQDIEDFLFQKGYTRVAENPINGIYLLKASR